MHKASYRQHVTQLGMKPSAFESSLSNAEIVPVNILRTQRDPQYQYGM